MMQTGKNYQQVVGCVDLPVSHLLTFFFKVPNLIIYVQD